MGCSTILLDRRIKMSSSKFALAVLTSVLMLITATVVRANAPQEPPIIENDVVIEYAGSAFWNCARYVDAVGDYAFLTMDFGLMILDVSDKSDPQIASRLYMPSATTRLQVVGNYAYICGGGDITAGTGWATLTIVDVSDVYNPYVASCFQSPDSVIGTSVKVVGNKAYVSGEGLHIINVSNPTSPYLISYSSHSLVGVDLEVVGDSVFITSPNRILAYNVTNPNDPWMFLSSISTETGWANGIEMANDLIYIANGDHGLTIIDPFNGPPYVLSHFPLDSGYWSWCMSRDLVLVDDTIIFIGGELSNSMKVLNVADPYAVDSIAKCGGHGSYARGMDYDNDYLYVARWEDGLFINNVANRAYPVEVGSFRECQDEPIDIEVRGNTGYLLFTDTIRIVDLSDPANITQIGWAEVGVNDALEVVGNTMLVGNSLGVTAFDISNPASPVYLDICLTDYHYVKSVEAEGDYAYITMWRYGFGIIDISDPNNLVMVGSYVDEDYWPTEINSKHIGWIILGEYALVNFYSPESLEYGFLVLDISDPTNPLPVKEHILPHQLLSVDLIGSMLYFGHYASGSMFVWDVSDPLHPVEKATWFPDGFVNFAPYVISHIGGYLLVEDWYRNVLLVVDPSGWIDSCSGGEVARIQPHRVATHITAAGNQIYKTSYGGLEVFTLGLDFVCGDVNDDGGFGIDIADLVYLVDYMFNGGPPPPDMTAANIDGEPGITISDLVYLVDYMFNGGPAPIC